jgi:hypothetical protein
VFTAADFPLLRCFSSTWSPEERHVSHDGPRGEGLLCFTCWQEGHLAWVCTRGSLAGKDALHERQSGVSEEGWAQQMAEDELG